MACVSFTLQSMNRMISNELGYGASMGCKSGSRFFVWLPAGGGGLASHGVQRGVGSSFLGCLVGQRKTKLVPPCAPRHSMNQKREHRPRLEERLDYNARKDPDTLGAVPRASARAHLRPGLQPAPHPSAFFNVINLKLGGTVPPHK